MNTKNLFYRCISLVCLLACNSHAAATGCYSEVDKFLDKVASPHSSFNSTDISPAVWSQSHSIIALTDAHRGTDSITVLENLADHLEHMLLYTSEENATSTTFRDVLRGNNPQPAWGTTEYTCNQYTVHAVHTGVLAYPMAYFAKAVLADPARYDAIEYEVGTSYYDLGVKYLDAAEDAINIHASEFIQNTTSGNWHYRFPNNMDDLGSCTGEDFSNHPGKYLPYNQMLAPGLVHIELGRAFELPGTTQNLTKASYHLDRATKLAKSFKDAFTYSSTTDSYTWLYNDNPPESQRSEDTSHGSIDIRFVVLAFMEGLYFTETDLKRLANTFKQITEDPSDVDSHLTQDSGFETRWQEGAVRWADLALVDRVVYNTARKIYHSYDGGYVSATSSDNIQGEALLFKWKLDNFRFPRHAASFSSSLPAFKPLESLANENWTGLYRTSTMDPGNLDDISVTSCAKYTFEHMESLPIVVRYAHTQTEINGDTCASPYCGESPSFYLFFSDDNAFWEHADSMPIENEDVFHVESVTSPIGDYKYVTACRSGAGHNKNNLQVKYLAADSQSCATSSGLDHSYAFGGSSQGWTAASCTDYTVTHSTGSSGHEGDYLTGYEQTGGGDHTCNPAATGNMEMAFYRDFANTAESFRVSGWTRTTTSYSGTSAVTNRCVKVLNASNNSVLHSHCTDWTNTTDSDWRYFEYDFTPYVSGVSNVRVAIGAYDSWSADWDQKIVIDDVKVWSP